MPDRNSSHAGLRTARAKTQRHQADPAAPFQVTRAVGRTGDGGTPLLCITLDGVLPMVIALRPVDILALGQWFNAQRPLAARRVEQKARERDQRDTEETEAR